MRLLIAGATGFVGRRLVETLMEAGDEVCAVVRRADHGLACDAFLVDDALDPQAYADIARTNGTEVVINLTAAGVTPSERNVDVLLEVNATFPARLAQAVAQAGARAFIHMGSSAEYAPDHTMAPIGEAATLEAERLYGATKAAGSLLVQTVVRNAGMPGAVLRAFNIFGPGEKPYRLFPALVEGLSQGRPINLSEGGQLRDFLYVDDVAAAIRRVACALLEDGSCGGVYNLGSGEPLAVRDFALAVARILNADEQLLRFGALPLRPDDLPYVVADTSKLARAIGPAKRRTLEEAIESGARAICAGGSS